MGPGPFDLGVSQTQAELLVLSLVGLLAAGLVLWLAQLKKGPRR